MTRRPLLLACLLVLCVGLAPAHDAAALCMAARPSASIMTPLDAPLPRDGSLLVQLNYGYATAGVAVQETVQGGLALPPVALVRGAERISMVPTNLPGGLVRLDFQRPPAPGSYVLEGLAAQGAAPPAVTIGGALPAAPVLPRATGVTHAEEENERDGPRGRVRSTHWTTRVTFERAFSYPNALLVLKPVGAGDTQLMQAVMDGTTIEGQGSSGGRCGAPNVPGRGRVTVGSDVQVMLVDMYGRVSAPSPRVSVQRARR